MTPEAQRLAAELRRWADAIEDEFCGKTLPLRRIGDAGDCAAPVMREAAKLLASLIPAGGLAEEAQQASRRTYRASVLEEAAKVAETEPCVWTQAPDPQTRIAAKIRALAEKEADR